MIDYNTLDDSDKLSLLESCSDFLQTVSRIYGAAIGQQIFDKLAIELGPEVGEAVWMALIAGERGGFYASVPSEPARVKYVECIKQVRAYLSLDLLPAKRIIDSIRDGTPRKFKADEVGGLIKMRQLRDALRQAGLSCS